MSLAGARFGRAIGPVKGVAFDCDGVMISSIDANREFYNRILAYYGHRLVYMPGMVAQVGEPFTQPHPLLP